MAGIEKRKNGYVIKASLGYDANGKQIKRSFTWKPSPGLTQRAIEKELQRQAFMFEEKCKSEGLIKSSMTFSEFASMWFRDYAQRALKPTTLSGYRNMLKRTNQAIGHLRLDKIKPQHLQRFYNNLLEPNIREDTKLTPVEGFKGKMRELGFTQKRLTELSGISEATLRRLYNERTVNNETAERLCNALRMDKWELFQQPKDSKPLSPKTVKEHHQFISSILKTAVLWGYLAQNPAERVRTPKASRREAEYLNEEEAMKLLKLLDCEDIQFKTMVYILMFGGLRRGELLGLMWSDINWDKRTLKIQRNVQYTSETGIYISSPKTDSSIREIHVPPIVLDLLKEYRKWQLQERMLIGDKWEDNDLLFTQWNGRPMFPDTPSKKFREFIKKTDLPHITVHSLRHTSATLLIVGGLDVRTVSQRLGHSRASTTLDIYSHAIKSADEMASKTLETMLKGPQTEQAK